MAAHQKNDVASLKTRWPHGHEFMVKMRERIGPRAIVAFSSGKDAVAMSLLMKPYFDELIPYTCYYVPGLRVMEEALTYYERELFGRPIIRAPHPVLITWLSELRYQTPESAKRVYRANLPRSHSFLSIVNEIERTHGLPEKGLYAVGSRAGEFFARAIQVARHGGIVAEKRQWWPIWEKSRDETLDIIEAAGLKLSREYDLYHASFCGLDYGHVATMKRLAPDDYATVRRYFPLIDAESIRFDRQDDNEKMASATRTREQDEARRAATKAGA